MMVASPDHRRMTDVFISYARKDQPFVRTLCAALEARQRDAWVDWEGIAPTAAWLSEIKAAIDAADTFVFVISPESLASEVCALELDHAVQHNKRLVPLVRREAEGRPVPAALARLNWIFMREQDELDAAVDTLVQALDTDLDHVKLHTRYLQRALQWQARDFDNSDALRGRDLVDAESWLAQSGGKAPQPTSLHNRYVIDSRRATTRRQRLAGAAVGVGVLVAAVLGLLALQERQAKRQNQQRAIANQLAGESRLALDERDDGLVDAVGLAAEAMRRLDSLGERSLAVDQALRRALALLPSPPAVIALDAEGETRAVGFSTGAAHVAIATSLGRVRVVDLNERRTVGAWTLPMQAGDSLRAIAVDAGGTRVAVWNYASGTGHSRLSLWDAARAVEITSCDRDHDFKGPGAALGPQGKLWVDSTVWRFDGCQPGPIGDPPAIVGALTLSPDGGKIAASVRERGDRQRWIELRDAQSGARLARWPHGDAIAQLWWGDGDRRLAAVDFNRRDFLRWDIASPGRPSELRLAEPVVAVADGAVATGVRDSSVLRIRSSATGAETHRLLHPGPVQAAAFSADGQTLTALVGKQLWRWPLAAAVDLGSAASRPMAAPTAVTLPDILQARIEAEGKTVLAVAPCPDLRTLAVTSGSITRAGWQARTELWSVPQARSLQSFDLLQTLGSGMRGLDDRAAALLACSADGRLLAMPARDAVVVREVEGGALVARLSHPGLRAVAFTPDAAFGATTGRGPVRIWQLDTGAEVARLLDETPVESLAFSDDGRVLATRRADRTQTHFWQPRQMIGAACARLPRPLSPETWQRLFPDVAYVETCAAVGAASASTR